MRSPNGDSRFHAYWRDAKRKEYRALMRTLCKLTDLHSGCDSMRQRMLAEEYGESEDVNRVQARLDRHIDTVRRLYGGASR